MVAQFEASVKIYPLIPVGTPDPYTPEVERGRESGSRALRCNDPEVLLNLKPKERSDRPHHPAFAARSP
jgi:hypothetical protein